MKAFTDISQSKRLAKILPIESADMHYVRKVCDFRGRPVDGKWSEPKYGNTNSDYANYIVQNFTQYDKLPCWSLAALLEIIHKDFYIVLDHDGVAWTCNVRQHDHRDIKDGYWGGDPVDVCVELILKLHKEKLL